jgi:hypothetical protein
MSLARATVDIQQAHRTPLARIDVVDPDTGQIGRRGEVGLAIHAVPLDVRAISCEATAWQGSEIFQGGSSQRLNIDEAGT